MKPFTYERAADTQAAIGAVTGRPNAKFIAGGTNLIDLMKLQNRDAGPSRRRQSSAAGEDRGGRRWIAHRRPGPQTAALPRTVECGRDIAC